MPKVAIIDYEMSNLFSVKHACEHVGLAAEITSDPLALMKMDGAILPGVGAFGYAMENLKKLDLIQAIRDFVSSGKPLLGICLGLQLLFSESEEFGYTEGLNILPGKVKRITSSDNQVKVPHIGWNQIHGPSPDSAAWTNTPLRSVKHGQQMYFVHSNYVIPDDQQLVLSHTTYHELQFCSGIQDNNVFAVQFHPEKSSLEGVRIYSDWASQISTD